MSTTLYSNGIPSQEADAADDIASLLANMLPFLNNNHNKNKTVYDDNANRENKLFYNSIEDAFYDSKINGNINPRNTMTHHTTHVQENEPYQKEVVLSGSTSSGMTGSFHNNSNPNNNNNHYNKDVSSMQPTLQGVLSSSGLTGSRVPLTSPATTSSDSSYLPTTGKVSLSETLANKKSGLQEDYYYIFSPTKSTMFSIPPAAIVPTEGSIHYRAKNKDKHVFSFCLCRNYSAGLSCQHGERCDFIHCPKEVLASLADNNNNTNVGVISPPCQRQSVFHNPNFESETSNHNGKENLKSFQVHWSTPIASVEKCIYERLPAGYPIVVRGTHNNNNNNNTNTNGLIHPFNEVYPSELLYKTVGGEEAIRMIREHNQNQNNHHHPSYKNKETTITPLQLCKHYMREKCARGPLCHFVHPIILENNKNNNNNNNNNNGIQSFPQQNNNMNNNNNNNNNNNICAVVGNNNNNNNNGADSNNNIIIIMMPQEDGSYRVVSNNNNNNMNMNNMSNHNNFNNNNGNMNNNNNKMMFMNNFQKDCFPPHNNDTNHNNMPLASFSFNNNNGNHNNMNNNNNNNNNGFVPSLPVDFNNFLKFTMQQNNNNNNNMNNTPSNFLPFPLPNNNNNFSNFQNQIRFQ
ncbi:hypothetical protein ADEAN_000344100 [Angomonas deanei]|uniref:C3H1-type domain-containing protein n=1 Tax=Angomonas deanei TaxID=59799 RepID=A0A7G2CB60_9TRYP|nr:hypothetical protein ADEAN_000344100 [Angomonas deanei]